MTFKLGLTGSIGMGKSTTATLFQAEGCDVWDADACVHHLYAKGGAAVEQFRTTLPQAIENEQVSREKLKQLLTDDPSLFKVLEDIVHPLVAADRARFIETATSDIVVLDIPLLFETGGNVLMDAVVTVYVDASLQKQRVLERGTMTEQQLDQILARQMPIQDKLAQSDYKIHTDTLEHARQQVKDILRTIRKTQ